MHIPLGILAEDESDVDVLKIFIQKISPNKKFSFKWRVGNGCGKLHRKCRDWAEDLKNKGCKYLIIARDLDRLPSAPKLKAEINNNLSPSPIKKYEIIVPI